MAEVPAELVIIALRERLSEVEYENAILRAQLTTRNDTTGDIHGGAERGGVGGSPVSE
jgi:hypothetical protein